MTDLHRHEFNDGCCTICGEIGPEWEWVSVEGEYKFEGSYEVMVADGCVWLRVPAGADTEASEYD